MKFSLYSLALLSTLGLGGCAQPLPGQGDDEVNYDKVEFPTRDQAASPEKARTVNITNHGGPVMTTTSNIYYIWYGDQWTGNTATTILPDLATSMGGSAYWGINTSYYSGSTTKTYVTNSATYKGSTSVSTAKYGATLSDANILSIVKDYIGTAAPDPNGIYMVLTSAEVKESSGFCTQYCGWHSNATVNGADTKYAFVGNPDQCPSSCEMYTTGPNSNAGADGMASIIAHEWEETLTDPDLNAWYDSRGAENGDKCAWTFGTTYTAANGAKYNVTLGARQYLIQQNWSASSQSCKMQ